MSRLPARFGASLVLALAIGCSDAEPAAEGAPQAGDAATDGGDQMSRSQMGMDAGSSRDAGDAASGAQSEARFTSHPSDRASYIYDPEEVRSYELRLDPAALAFLDADPRAELYVEGLLEFEGKTYGPVGVRYKGSIGAFRDCTETQMGGAKTCRKLSIKVKFDWDDPEARFFGLKKLQFHGMQRDPSKLRERLGYWLFREFDVPAPRAVHARLSINGEYVGVHALVEQIDGRFTRSRYSDGTGNLYKEVWPVTAAGGVPTMQAIETGLRSNRDEDPSFERLLRFSEGLTSEDIAERLDTLERWTDMDTTMRYVALDRAQADDDGAFHWYCAGGSGTGCFNHNFYWYEETQADRLWVIPWDLDSSFNLNNPTTTIWLDWEDRTPGCGALSQAGFNPLRVPVCDKVIQSWASLQRRYLDTLRDLLDGPFAEGVAEAKLDTWERQIFPHVEEEATLHPDSPLEAWNTARGELRGALKTLRARARTRLERGEHQLWATPDMPEPDTRDADGGT